uniref:Uncharacterized protein n=1 Tax=Arundo donax TaxID=35708 RepID=A0A0A9HQA1_ARUDO
MAVVFACQAYNQYNQNMYQ